MLNDEKELLEIRMPLDEGMGYSLSKLMILNCKEWLVHLKAVLPFSGTLIGWKAGQRETW